MIITLLLALSLGPADPVRSDECLSCHKVGPVSHRVEIAVPKAPPELLVAGRIECTSCHVSHDREASEPYRLRAEQTVLCTGCHKME